MTDHPLILMDLNQTLVDPDEKLTDPRLPSQIKRMIADGWMLGMTSDNAHSFLRSFYERFGLNGPLVTELGTGIHIPGLNPEPMWQNEALLPVFMNLHHSFVAMLTQEYPGINKFYGSSHDMRIMMDVGMKNQDTDWLMIQEGRLRSMMFLCFHQNRRGMEFNPTLANELVARVKELFSDLSDIDPLVCPELDWASIYIHGPDSAKAVAAEALHDHFGHDEMIVIGDGRLDIVDKPYATHCAVGNASEDLKQRASFVAESEYSAGARECLEWIQAQF